MILDQCIDIFPYQYVLQIPNGPLKYSTPDPSVANFVAIDGLPNHLRHHRRSPLAQIRSCLPKLQCSCIDFWMGSYISVQEDGPPYLRGN